jgi:hypothetical protein
MPLTRALLEEMATDETIGDADDLEMMAGLLQNLREATPHSDAHNKALAELQWMSTVIQLQATKFQIRAAKAEEAAAGATQQNAKYMLASVVVAAVASFASAVSAYFAWYGATHAMHP